MIDLTFQAGPARDLAQRTHLTRQSPSRAVGKRGSIAVAGDEPFDAPPNMWSRRRRGGLPGTGDTISGGEKHQ